MNEQMQRNVNFCSKTEAELIKSSLYNICKKGVGTVLKSTLCQIW